MFTFPAVFFPLETYETHKEAIYNCLLDNTEEIHVFRIGIEKTDTEFSKREHLLEALLAVNFAGIPHIRLIGTGSDQMYLRIHRSEEENTIVFCVFHYRPELWEGGTWKYLVEFRDRFVAKLKELEIPHRINT